MSFLTTIAIIIGAIFFAYIAFAALYVFVFSVAGSLQPKQKQPKIINKQRKIAVVIPGYKEDNVIVSVAEEATRQNYPAELFDVFVLADSFAAETVTKLKALPIQVMEVVFEESSKTKSLLHAANTIDASYEIALILDADNVMAPDFLQRLNAGFEAGYTAIQGHRVAKNVNTPFAVLDALSEEINNHIFRKGHRALGLSSAFIGSGMALEFSLFKQLIAKVGTTCGAEDKEIELELLSDGVTIEYLNDALVYDEKIQNAKVFEGQRKRWMDSQYEYAKPFLWKSIRALFTQGNINLIDKVYQMFMPPRVVLLGSTVLLFFGFLFVHLFVTNSVQNWLVASGIVLFMVVFSYAIAVPKQYYTLQLFKAIVLVPKAFFIMFKNVLVARGANKKYFHTAHGVIQNK